jgi:hypothetical protein
MINQTARTPQELNYLRGYIGLQSNGVVKNFVWLAPKPTKKIIHIGFLNTIAGEWKQRFEEAGVPVSSRHKRRFRVSVTPEEFQVQQELIREAIVETVKESDA